MSVRYVLTAVLPRYTMSGARPSTPPTVTDRSKPHAMKDVDGQWFAVIPQAYGRDLDVMGHD